MGIDEAWLRENYAGDLDAVLAAQARVPAVTVAEPPRARKAAHVRGEMNQTERRFMEFVKAGHWPWIVRDWSFEEENLVLSPDMKYLPDFCLSVVERDDLETEVIHCVDVKGKHTFEDSIVKAKAAAVIFPERKFFIAQLKDGEWRIRRMGVAGRQTIKVPA